MSSPKNYGAIDLYDIRSAQKNNKYGAVDIDSFKSKPEEESGLMSAARYATQVPQGIAEATPPGILANLWSMFAHGESELDPYEEAQMSEAYKRAGKDFDIEEYQAQRQKALSTLPTVSNIGREVEDITGIPLEAKTTGQKLLRMGSSSATFQPGGTAPKAVAGVVAPSVSGGLQALGVPEVFSDPVGYLVGNRTGSKVPEATLTKTKPSGLVERRYENLQEPVKVSSKKLEKINQSLETEFRGIADKILEESPVHDIRSALKEGPAYKEMIKERFGEVEKLAENIPEQFSTKVVKKQLIDNISKQKKPGFIATEHEKSYNAVVKDILKGFKEQKTDAIGLVKQFRQLNESQRGLWEPGKSFAYNQAKRQAYSDASKSIADVIESQFPNSEFSKLFRENNKDWSMIMDAEAIDKFFDGMFDGKVQFKKGNEFFDKNGMTKPFERALGKEGFKDFKQLMNDLMTKEEGFKLMKEAQSQGFFKDAGQHALTFFISPKLEAAKLSYNLFKGTQKSLFEMVLDKPQFSLKWDKGVKAMKNWDFETAEKVYKDLDSSIQKES